MWWLMGSPLPLCWCLASNQQHKFGTATVDCNDWAAAWAGVELEDELPDNEYREYFAPDYRLSIPLRADVENLNTREYLDQLKRKLFATLARCDRAARLRPPNPEGVVLPSEHAC